MNALARSACGGLEVVIANTAAVLRPSGALWLAATRTLAVADLHFEKGSAYARGQQFLPPYDSCATLLRMARAVARHRPTVIVALGDSFHDGGAAERLGDLLARIKGRIRHARLDHLSPFSVPMILEIGRQRSPGGAGEMILAEAAETLIAEAIA